MKHLFYFIYAILFAASTSAFAKCERYLEDKDVQVKSVAESFGLRMAEPDDMTIVRDGKPGHFVYRSENNKKTVNSQQVQRIEGLKIPPMWKRVLISQYEQDHLQAVGYDQAGRMQYLYHPNWTQVRDKIKFDRLEGFPHALSKIRRQVKIDLAKKDIRAVMVRILDLTGIRPGNEKNVQEYNSYGLTTLRKRHVTIEGSNIQLKFRGKKGQENTFTFNDPAVAKALENLMSIKGRDALFDVTAADLNSYIEKLSDGEFTAKDFRTWRGTVAAVDSLSKATFPASEREFSRLVKQTAREVAGLLNNTAPVVLKSYIDPIVFSEFKSRSGFQNVMSRALRRNRDARSVPEEMTMILLDETSSQIKTN